jgi:hypothetical protein
MLAYSVPNCRWVCRHLVSHGDGIPTGFRSITALPHTAQPLSQDGGVRRQMKMRQYLAQATGRRASPAHKALRLLDSYGVRCHTRTALVNTTPAGGEVTTLSEISSTIAPGYLRLLDETTRRVVGLPPTSERTTAHKGT